MYVKIGVKNEKLPSWTLQVLNALANTLNAIKKLDIWIRNIQKIVFRHKKFYSKKQ